MLPNIERLIFENNRFTGKLPATLGHLKTLVHIFFSNNHFSGKIPSSFGNLQNLQTLDLSRNHIQGSIPPQLAKLRLLQTLHLSSNPLNLVRLPHWLSKLNLFRLNLAKTGVTGNLPRWFSSTSISILDLSSNRLSEFNNLSLLMDLDLHSNKFTGDLGTIFSKSTKDPLGHYNSIDVSRNRFVGPIDGNVGNEVSMESIQVLVLSYNPLGGAIPKSLGKLRELKKLELKENGLTGKIPSQLGEAKELTSLVLADNKLIGSIPEQVINLEELTEFDVAGNRLNGRIPSHKAKIPASSFKDNPGLCGFPLLSCKHH
ncbi:hypothetical protein MKW92_030114 [Papaver armeniacum]|nr:hypothetical protein MKW92_030114 [Papaver armeniacum]